MYLRRLTLVTFAAPILLAACSSDSENDRTPFGGQPTQQQPSDGTQAPEMQGIPPATPDPTATDLTPPGNEGQNPDTPLEQPAASPVEGGEGEPPAPGEPPVEPVDPGAVIPPLSVEDTGTDCVVPTLPAGNTLPSSNLLPDPFTKLDGTRLTQKSEWRCRRKEILQQAQQYIYGTKPVKPQQVTGTVSNTQVAVNIQHNGMNESFTAAVTLPAGQGPFPAVIAFSGGGVANVMAGMGVAVINFNQDSVGSRNSGLFARLYGNNSGAGDLAAWAWGASRIIDVIQDSDQSIIDAKRLAVTGCSFLGKAAFATGALDERIALVAPLESGIGGVPSYKIVPQLEPNPTGAGDGPEQPQHAINNGWLPANSLVADFNRLPVDTHEIIGLVAPRGLLVLGNNGTQGQYYKNLDFRSEYATVVAGKEIFAALGVADNLTYDSHGVNHCVNADRFTTAVQASVDRFLLGGDSATGELTTDWEGVRTDPAPYKNWTAPTLEGEL